MCKDPNSDEIPTSSGQTDPPQRQDLCSSMDDCHRNAECKYKYETSRYECECKQHYIGDGIYSCEPGPSNKLQKKIIFPIYFFLF